MFDRKAYASRMDIENLKTFAASCRGLTRPLLIMSLFSLATPKAARTGGVPLGRRTASALHLDGSPASHSTRSGASECQWVTTWRR